MNSNKPLPPDFGYNPNGSFLSNNDTILQDVNTALGVSKPPDIEILLAEHICSTHSKLSEWIHLHLIRFGHVAIKYRTSDGKEYVMNINGDFSSDPDAKMVYFIDPAMYLFGTDPILSPQGGVYNRPFVGVRIENVADGATNALHAYFQALDKASAIEMKTKDEKCQKAGCDDDEGPAQKNPFAQPGSSRRGSVQFQLVDINLSTISRHLPHQLGDALERLSRKFQQQHERLQQSNIHQNNVVNSLQSASGKALEAISNSKHNIQEQVQKTVDGKDLPQDVRDFREATYVAGNCAQWSSRGLAFAGLLRRPRLYPKAILIDILEDEYLMGNRPSNVNVVVYDIVNHAKKKTDWGEFRYIESAFVHPLKPFRNWWYKEPRDFAHVIVKVPPGTDRAEICSQQPSREPKHVFRYLSIASIVGPAAIMFGLVDQIGPVGPMGAAMWLGISWWLY
jgi:hypothetical protein